MERVTEEGEIRKRREGMKGKGEGLEGEKRVVNRDFDFGGGGGGVTHNGGGIKNSSSSLYTLYVL